MSKNIRKTEKRKFNFFISTFLFGKKKFIDKKDLFYAQIMRQS